MSQETKMKTRVSHVVTEELKSSSAVFPDHPLQSSTNCSQQESPAGGGGTREGKQENLFLINTKTREPFPQQSASRTGHGSGHHCAKVLHQIKWG